MVETLQFTFVRGNSVLSFHSGNSFSTQKKKVGTVCLFGSSGTYPRNDALRGSVGSFFPVCPLLATNIVFTNEIGNQHILS